MTVNRQASVVAFIAILMGCPGGTESADVGIPPDAVDATRTFALGLEALSYKVGGIPRWSFDPEVTQVPVAMADGALHLAS